MAELAQEAVRDEEFLDLMGRRGVVHLGADEIRRMLDLPEDVYVTGVTADFYTNSIAIAVVSKRLGKTPEDTEAPVISGGLSKSILIDPDSGTPYYRFDLGLGEARDGD